MRLSQDLGLIRSSIRLPDLTVKLPNCVLTTTPSGRYLDGRGRFLAIVHSSVAEGQYTQPFLLQISISPLSLTDQAQRILLSMHIPTAVRPSVAEAELAENKHAKATSIEQMIYFIV